MFRIRNLLFSPSPGSGPDTSVFFGTSCPKMDSQVIIKIKMSWLDYHNIEELFIAILSFVVSIRVYLRKRSATGEENRARLIIYSSGFFILSISSFIHAMIHILALDDNLLFQTLTGYSIGLLLLILAISSKEPEKKTLLPFLLYMPLIVLLLPDIYRSLPDFKLFRPLIWIIVAYLSGTLSILHIVMYRNLSVRPLFYISLGYALIAVSGVFLFFPSAIGSTPWLHGHLMRPIGFLIIFLSTNKDVLNSLRGSILYKALSAFSLLSGLPMIFLGITILYQEISPMDIISSRLLIFLMLMTTLIVALIFGIGVITRLINPIVSLKKDVDHLTEKGLSHRVQISPSRDEIEELAHSFNRMASDLEKSVAEQLRLSRLAATGELAATLAHEIRNPLNAIQGAASYIRKNFRGALITEFLKIITDEVSRINKLTTNLLNFARPVTPNLSSSNLNDLVSNTIELIKGEFLQKGVNLEKELDERLPETLVDASQIKQVLINLLINALDATDAGGYVRIITDSSDGKIMVSVIDSGKGIKKEDIKSIFNPFFTTKTSGTGLGLAIADRIAKEHGGEITVESSENMGSRFCLILPLRER